MECLSDVGDLLGSCQMEQNSFQKYQILLQSKNTNYIGLTTRKGMFILGYFDPKKGLF